jgi:putative transposase
MQRHVPKASVDAILVVVRSYLIHDRDPLFAKSFKVRLASSGVRPIRLPVRSPILRASAERFVRSIKLEFLAQVIPFGERQAPSRGEGMHRTIPA